MANFAQVGARNLEQLVTEVNNMLNNGAPTEDNIYQRIAVTATGGALWEQFPIALSSVAEVEKDLIEERDYVTPSVKNFMCTVKRVERPVTMFPVYQNLVDPNNAYYGRVENEVRRIKRMPERRLSKLINLNGTAYDGQPFFSKTHIANPNRINSPTYTNDETADMTTAGVTKAFDTFMGMIGEDGNFFNTDIGRFICLVPTPTLANQARELFNKGLIARYFGNAAASATTQLEGAADVVLMPELTKDLNLNPNANKTWYLIRESTADQASFIYRQAEAPKMLYFGLDSTLFETKNAIGYQTTAVVGEAYAAPQCIVRLTLP